MYKELFLKKIKYVNKSGIEMQPGLIAVFYNGVQHSSKIILKQTKVKECQDFPSH